MQIVKRIKAKLAEVTGAVTEENLFVTLIGIAIIAAIVGVTKLPFFGQILMRLIGAVIEYFLSFFHIG